MTKDSIYRNDLSTDKKVLMALVRAAEIFKRAHSVVFRNHGFLSAVQRPAASNLPETGTIRSAT